MSLSLLHHPGKPHLHHVPVRPTVVPNHLRPRAAPEDAVLSRHVTAQFLSWYGDQAWRVIATGHGTSVRAAFEEGYRRGMKHGF